ncbi:unnamed protein product [Peniophora sp. CBMAI 1063]|nr:unnamed protein product [Peniophora sp. CBMAI 1063]
MDGENAAGLLTPPGGASAPVTPVQPDNAPMETGPEPTEINAPAGSHAQAVQALATTSAPAPPPIQSQGGGASGIPNMDGLVARIVASSNIHEAPQLARLLNDISNRDAVLLLQPVQGNQDPLAVLNPSLHTLGMIYILTARLRAAPNMAPPLDLGLLSTFCKHFDPEQARLAPDRVSQLANAILNFAQGHHDNAQIAVGPLYDLLMRYCPDTTQLTTLHTPFLLACVASQSYAIALPIISKPITNIGLGLSPDLTYKDHLIYHYTAGVAAAALRRWDLAAYLLETAASAPVSTGRAGGAGPLPMGPGMSGGMMSGSRGGEGRSMRFPGSSGGEPSTIQIDAAKKLVLVHLIHHGKSMALPKYTHPAVARIATASSPYGAFARSYPAQTANMMAVVEKEQPNFVNDGNFGLLKQAITRAPRWTIKRLTETYLTLGLAEIGQSVGIDDAEEVRRVVLSMIEAREINATISADGTIAFEDDPPVSVTKTQMDAVLARAQAQEKMLRALEKEMAVSKEYLSKAVRGRDDGGAPWADAEDQWQIPGSSSGIPEESLF